MANIKNVRNRLLITILSACLLLQPVGAYARGDGHGESRHSGHGDSHHSSFYYAAPLFGSLTYLYCLAAASQRREHETTYVVVPAREATVVAAREEADEEYAETLVVNIPNSNGSYTRVVLRKSGNGYIGPQGEFYPTHPTVKQLRVLYGK
jgi:hypothetical protein